MPEHLLTLAHWDRARLTGVLDLAAAIKHDPGAFADAARRKTLFMVFEKPSLRTRVSFETGIARMGGHAIHYDTSRSPMGAGKESLEDTIRVVSRYADLIMARLFRQTDLERMAAHARVPVINGLTDYDHPCQILADLLTIREKKGRLEGLRLAYLGDGNNNVTHALLFGCALAGMHVRVGCPADPEVCTAAEVLALARRLAGPGGPSMEVVHDAREATRGADVVYTDSWMSYHIPKEDLDRRVALFQPFQIDAALMALAAPEAIFMNCLPAQRGYEQTAEVIDGPQSVVFDQAENRLWAQNAVMLRLLGLR
jgi:ornithine carbamoyltransferase